MLTRPLRTERTNSSTQLSTPCRGAGQALLVISKPLSHHHAIHPTPSASDYSAVTYGCIPSWLIPTVRMCHSFVAAGPWETGATGGWPAIPGNGHGAVSWHGREGRVTGARTRWRIRGSVRKRRGGPSTGGPRARGWFHPVLDRGRRGDGPRHRGGRAAAGGAAAGRRSAAGAAGSGPGGVRPAAAEAGGGPGRRASRTPAPWNGRSGTPPPSAVRRRRGCFPGGPAGPCRHRTAGAAAGQ